jgi:hypothetical protein
MPSSVLTTRLPAVVPVWAMAYVLLGVDTSTALMVGGILLVLVFLTPDPLISRTPDPIEDCNIVRGDSSSPLMKKGQPVKILSWNIQFCATRKHLFFYDRGKAVSVPMDDVTQTMKMVADVIIEANPDIVLLQEVDMNSKRTNYTNQLAGILKHLDEAGLNFPNVATAPYHQCNWVPAPSHEHMGKVDFHMAGTSEFLPALEIVSPDLAHSVSTGSLVQVPDCKGHTPPAPSSERVLAAPSLQFEACGDGYTLCGQRRGRVRNSKHPPLCIRLQRRHARTRDRNALRPYSATRWWWCSVDARW